MDCYPQHWISISCVSLNSANSWYTMVWGETAVLLLPQWVPGQSDNDTKIISAQTWHNFVVIIPGSRWAVVAAESEIKKLFLKTIFAAVLLTPGVSDQHQLIFTGQYQDHGICSIYNNMASQQLTQETYQNLVIHCYNMTRDHLPRPGTVNTVALLLPPSWCHQLII